MKSIEELALGTADVAAITGKAIADTIEEVARGEVVFAQLFKPNEDLKRPNTPRQIQFPKKGTGISVTWGASPGATIASSSFTYDAVTVTVTKSGIRLEFTNEALEQAMRDVIKDHIYEAGLEWAEVLDDVAQTVMLDLTTQTCTVATGSLGTFPNTPVIKITDVPSSATISSVEYDTGKVTLTGSVTAATITSVYSDYLSSTTLWVGASSAGSLSAKDILRVRSKLVAKHRKPDVLIINDADLASLLFDPNVKFVDVSAYGSNEALMNAEIGKIFGMKVVTSSRAPQGNAFVVDSKRLGYDVRKRDLSGVREDKPDYDSVWYHFWAERNFGVADSLAVGAVVNAQSSDYEYPAA